MVTRRGKEESNTNGNGKGKIKFRYMDSERLVDFSVENMAGDSVTDGLHSIANALAGRTLPRKGAPDPKRQLAGGTTVDVEEEVDTLEPEDQEQGVLDPEPEGSEDGGAETPKPKRVIKPKAPKLLTTPNLTEAQVSLTDFLKQKNVTEMMDKYSVVAVWYKEQFQIVDINIDRIFTAFKVLGQESQLPTDIEKPLKNLTYVKKWFEKAKAPNTYNIIWLGESEVGKMGAGAVKA